MLQFVVFSSSNITLRRVWIVMEILRPNDDTSEGFDCGLRLWNVVRGSELRLRLRHNSCEEKDEDGITVSSDVREIL